MGNSAKVYSPSVEVRTVRVKPVAGFTSVTLASGTRAPEGSATEPVTAAVVAVCGHATETETSESRKLQATTRAFLRVLITSSSSNPAQAFKNCETKQAC